MRTKGFTDLANLFICTCESDVELNVNLLTGADNATHESLRVTFLMKQTWWQEKPPPGLSFIYSTHRT